MNYYKEQLEKLNPDSLKIKLTDSEGNSTSWLDLNPESIAALMEYLKNVTFSRQGDEDSGVL